MVINEADRLSKEAQGALRRTMEKYMTNCRMVLVCTHAHKLIMPIRSRCINIRVPAPTIDEVREVLKDVLRQESGINLGSDVVEQIVRGCNRNLREALIQLQATKYVKSPEALVAPFKKEVRDIVDLIWKEQSPSQLKAIRERFYSVLVNCVEGRTVISEMLDNIINRKELPEKFQLEVLHQAAEHERTLVNGSKTIMHL